MGPITLVDKSFLQSLSRDEVYYFFNHYLLCIPRVLVMEIQADLSKTPKPGKLAEDEVRIIADKLLGWGSGVSTHYRKIAIASLLGEAIPMDTGQILVDTGVPVRGKDGKLGVVIEEPIEKKMIRAWQEGVFSEKDRQIAAKYRAATTGFNLEKIKQTVNKNTPKLKLSSLQKVVEYVDTYLESFSEAVQSEHLSNYLEMAQANEAFRTAVFNRWMKLKMPSFRQFAPYAFFCYRINLTFMLGVLTGNITTRPTNAIDVEYLYYLPFCFIFVSGDKLHKDMAPFFLRRDQTFVDGPALKEDLRLLKAEWETLSEEQKKDRAINYGSYPPQDDNFLTCRLWKKYMKPWRPGSGNIVSKLTEEQQKKIIDDIQEKLGPYFARKKGENDER